MSSTAGGVRSRRPAHHEEEHENHERWLISYADMVTLLFALFIVLYAMSIIDLDKYRAFQQSFAEDLGQGVEAAPGEDDLPSGVVVDADPGPGEGRTTGASLAREAEVPVEEAALGPLPPETLQALLDQAEADVDVEAVEPVTAEVAALAVEVSEGLAAAGLDASVEVLVQDRGVAVVVADAVLFTSGSADLLPAGRDVLARLAPVLLDTSGEMTIEGHTDDHPISTSRYPDNWELSTARATSVLRTVVATSGVAPGRVSASGYGDTRPRGDNAVEQGRADNRRVEVLLRPVVKPGEVVTPVGGAPGAPAAAPVDVGPVAAPDEAERVD